MVVINFVTRPVPKGFAVDGDIALGNRDFRRAAASIGSGSDAGGWLLSASQKQGDGSREGSEHRARDVSAKLELNLNPQHSLRAKIGWFDESSGFGEGGLDQARFDANPYANPFRNDRFELERTAAQLVHSWTPSANTRLSTQLYVQRIERASYRQLDAIAEFDGVSEEDGELVAEIENEELRALAPDDGEPNPACLVDGEAIDYTVPNGFENFASRCGNQMRPRKYTFYGVEPRLEMSHNAFGLRGELVAGMRLHREEVVRKRFNGTTPTSREGSPGTYFRDRFDIDTDAFAAYLQNTFYAGAWTVTPGVRYENYRLRNTAVLAREDRDVNNGRSVTVRSTKLLPGLGVTYLGLPGTTFFAGMHRGIAPPRPDANFDPTDPEFRAVKPEISTNIEAGLRSSPAPGRAGRGHGLPDRLQEPDRAGLRGGLGPDLHQRRRQPEPRHRARQRAWTSARCREAPATRT